MAVMWQYSPSDSWLLSALPLFAECFVVGTRQIDISADCFDFAKCFSSDTQLVCLVPDEIHLIK